MANIDTQIIYYKMMQNKDHSFERFMLFERKRQRALQELKSRRQEIFNKSRQLFLEQQGQSCDLEGLQENESMLESSSFPQQMFDVPQQMMEEELQLNKQQSGHEISDKILGKKPLQRNKINKNKSKKTFNYHIKKLFQTPDWMNSVPEDIGEFYGTARPDGKTVLILFDSDDSMKIYDRLGKKLATFKVKGKHYKDTILEGYFVTRDNALPQVYVSDMICWRGNIYTSEVFDFRYSWLQANFHNFRLALNEIEINLLEYFLVNLGNLQRIYTQNFGYEKEGLQFVHRNSFYLHENNPNVLIWKDMNTSKYPISSNPDNLIYGIGFCGKDRSIKTLDRYTVKSNNQIQGRDNCLVKFRFKQIITDFTQDEDHFIRMDGLEIVAVKKLHLGRQDPLSKLIFQHRARYDPLGIERICACLQ